MKKPLIAGNTRGRPPRFGFGFYTGAVGEVFQIAGPNVGARPGDERRACPGSLSSCVCAGCGCSSYLGAGTETIGYRRALVSPGGGVCGAGLGGATFIFREPEAPGRGLCHDHREAALKGAAFKSEAGAHGLRKRYPTALSEPAAEYKSPDPTMPGRALSKVASGGHEAEGVSAGAFAPGARA